MTQIKFARNFLDIRMASSSSNDATISNHTIEMKNTALEINATSYYAKGRVINLIDSGRESGDTDVAIDIEIVQQQNVANGRKSQVVLAKLISGVLRRGKDSKLIINNDSMILAKFYDAKYGPVARGWAHEQAQFCKNSKNAEKHAYQKLIDLQGSSIPEFYGEYRLTEFANTDEVSVILLQYIPDPPLYTTRILIPEELTTLKSRAFEILQQIHANGVYHGDIESRNLLWNSETQRLTFIDFDQAAFSDWNYGPQMITQEFVKHRKRDDIYLLWDMLCDLGVKDERPIGDVSPLAPPT